MLSKVLGSPATQESLGWEYYMGGYQQKSLGAQQGY